MSEDTPKINVVGVGEDVSTPTPAPDSPGEHPWREKIESFVASYPNPTPDTAAPRHELKTWPSYFRAIIGGTKTFELRRNDRDFETGDVLVLREWDPEHGLYSGRSVEREVTYVLRNAEAFGLQTGFVVLGLAARSASGTPTCGVQLSKWAGDDCCAPPGHHGPHISPDLPAGSGTAALTEDPPAHLTPTVTDRGFKHLPELAAAHRGITVRVYESSAARGPHVWLAIEDGDNPESSAHAHLAAAVARQVAEQLLYVVDNHYQGAGDGDE